MKTKELISILQGISNAYPDIEVVFDVHDPEPLAKAYLTNADVLSAMDVRDICIYLEGDGQVAIVTLTSPADIDCIYDHCNEFDRTYKK